MQIDLEQLLIQAQTLVTEFGVNILAALAIFIAGRWIAKGLTGALRKLMRRRDVESTLETFIGNFVYMGLLIFVILAALSQLGIQTASIIAVLGAAGLAVGLALQGSLSNFAAGILILLFKPYKAGDWIEAAGVAGKVEGLKIFTTSLVTGDNKLVVVPNSQITGGVITNYSAKDKRRIDMVVGVSYSDDLDKVRAVVSEVLQADDRVLAEPAATIAVNQLADSSVNFVVRPWVRTEDYWGAYFDLTETIKKRFDSEGISIPFPQRDIHLHKAD